MVSAGGPPAGRRRRFVVVGGGVAGLAAARRLARPAGAAPPPAVTVVEAASRPGGKVLSERSQGFLVEAGADSFLTARPAALELARALGLDGRLLAPGGGSGVAIVRRGRPLPLPAGLRLLVATRPLPLLASPLLSPAGRLRLLAERWVPPRRAGGSGGDDDGDGETLAAFSRRRLGREALDYLADPLLASISLGDPERLGVDDAWPMLADAERRWGSLTRAARQREPGDGPALLSLRGGLGELVEALVADLGSAGVEIRCGQAALALAPAAGGGWRLRLAGGAEVAADAVVLALPAAAAAGLLAAARPEPADELRRLPPPASVAVVSLGYRAADLAAAPAGHGFFVPAAEGRCLVAVTWSWRKLAGRAPAGRGLVRAFVGGVRGERWLELDDGALTAAVRSDLAQLAGVTAEPLLTRVHRWPDGYPQYELGYRRRVAAAEALCDPTLALAGGAFHGLGLPAAVTSGEAAAGRLETLLQRPSGSGSAVDAAARPW